MSGMLEKKRQAFASLLHVMQEMKDMVENGRFDELGGAGIRQEEIIGGIIALDQGQDGSLAPGNYSRAQIEEMTSLIAQIADISDLLRATVATEAQEVQKDLGTLHRHAGAAAGYRKQLNAKI